MKVEVVTPEENMGDIIGDLNKRRGQIAGMESRGNARVVDAKVPLSEMFGYVTVLQYDFFRPCDLFDGVLPFRGSACEPRQGDRRKVKWYKRNQ